MSGSTDAGRLLVRIEATTAQLRQELQKAQQAVGEASGKIDDNLKRGDKAFERLNAASKETQKAIEGLTARLGPLGGALSSVGAAGIAAGAGIAAIATGMLAVAKAGDTATATLAKLTSATGGIGAAQAAYEGLFRLSQQTGVSVAESAGAFARFAVAAKEVGATNDQVLRLVGGIQKAGIVAGASTEETKAAALQLAQALASGVLQGDELRSVLENMPQLAAALAKEFGVGIGELRKMGEEGKLTADQVLPRLLKAAEDIGKEFDKQPATMERSRDILLAATQDFGARLDKITKLSQTFAAFMLQGAAALRAMGDTVDQTPGGRTAAAAARLQALEGGIPAAPMDAAVQAFRDSQQYATAEQRRAMAGIPGRDPFDTTRQRLGASAGPRDASQDRARELAEARQELADAIAAEQGMLRDAREDRRADDEDAAAKRVEAARVQYKKIAEEIDKGLKTATSIEKKYQDERAKIQKLVDGQYWTEAQAKERLRVLDRERADALEALAKAENKGGEEAKKAAEKRDKAVLTLQEQVAAAQKARDATVAGEGASKAMALALEVENKIREAGIPITGKRTEAEQKAAEAIETNVRKLDELKESTKALEEAQKKATEAQKKFVDASRTALTDIPAKALDRLGDSLVDAFVRGEGAAVNFGNIVRGVIASAVADVAKLAVINPLMNSLFISSNGPRPTLIGASGGSPTAVGFGDLLGLGSLLGGGGISTAMSGIGASILGTSGGFAGGVMGATPAVSSGLLGLGGNSLLGGSLGGLSGAALGIGGGFAAGTLLNQLLGRSQNQQTNGMVGSGIGALGGFLIGGPIGGIIGGALGGGLGGAFGPGESVKGYGYQLNASGNGMLQMGKSFYNDTGAAAFKEAEQGIAALNAYLGARGLTVGGASIVGGNKDGADYSNATAGSFAEGVSQLYYHANDNQLEKVLAKSGNRFSSVEELQKLVEGFTQSKAAIEALTAEPVPAFNAQMKAVTEVFDAALTKAREYGLAEDKLTAARAKAVAELEAQRAETLRQSDASLEVRRLVAGGFNEQAELARQSEAARQEVDAFSKSLDALGLAAADKASRLVRLEEVQGAERAAIVKKYADQAAEAQRQASEAQARAVEQAAEEQRQAANAGTSLLRELTYGSSSALAPEQKYFAAISDLSAARQALDAGGSLSAYTAVAQAVLPVARDFLGTSTRYAGLAAEVGSVIASKGGDGNLAAILSAQANGMDGLQATLASLGTQQIAIASNTLNEMRRLVSTLEAWISRKVA